MRQILVTVLKYIPLYIRQNIKNSSFLKQLQSRLFDKYLNNISFIDTISSGPAKGLVFPISLPNDKLMWIGTWELDFAMFLKSCIKKDFVCYDIGGYKGYYAGVMALNGAKKVYIFEPMPSNIKSIQELIKLNDNLPIELHQIAISNFSGYTDFHLMSDATMGKLTSSEFQKDRVSNNIKSIQCDSIDNLVASGLPAPDFLKIDVEGAEILVLEGALKLIQDKKPILLIEIHSKSIGSQCYQILKKYYDSIIVFETRNQPGTNESEICHYICMN